jgi:hypothetical protein
MIPFNQQFPGINQYKLNPVGNLKSNCGPKFNIISYFCLNIGSRETTKWGLKGNTVKVGNSSRCCNLSLKVLHLATVGICRWEGPEPERESEDLPVYIRFWSLRRTGNESRCISLSRPSSASKSD